MFSTLSPCGVCSSIIESIYIRNHDECDDSSIIVSSSRMRACMSVRLYECRYKNLDRLIALVNDRKGDQLNAFYSSPTQYTDARAEEKLTWTVKSDDFFPYADCAHCYWSGYFTSR
jgi:hypothetical protein